MNYALSYDRKIEAHLLHARFLVECGLAPEALDMVRNSDFYKSNYITYGLPGLYILATGHYYLGEFEKALRVIKSVEEKSPLKPNVLIMKVLMETCKLAEAEARFQLLKKQNLSIQCRIAKFYRDSDQLEKSIALYSNVFDERIKQKDSYNDPYNLVKNYLQCCFLLDKPDMMEPILERYNSEFSHRFAIENILFSEGIVTSLNQSGGTIIAKSWFKPIDIFEFNDQNNSLNVGDIVNFIPKFKYTIKRINIATNIQLKNQVNIFSSKFCNNQPIIKFQSIVKFNGLIIKNFENMVQLSLHSTADDTYTTQRDKTFQRILF